MIISRKILVMLMIISLTVSFVIHMPTEAQETLFGKPFMTPIYSDIVDTYYRKVFLNPKICSAALGNGSPKDTVWVNTDIAKKLCLGEPIVPIIYRDYVIELPPLYGFLWFISTSFSLVVSGYNSMYSPYTNPSLRSLSLTVYYLIMSMFIYISAILLAVSLYDLVNYISINDRRTKLLYVLPLLPSFIVYGVYSVEIIAGSFMVLSILMLYRKRYYLSGLFIGLSVAIHLFPLIVVIVVFYELLQCREDLMRAYKYLLGFTTTFASYLIIMVINPLILTKLFIGSDGLMCENCIFLYLVGSPVNPLARSISIVSIVIATTLIMILHTRTRDLLSGIYSKIVIGLLAITTLHYIFKPQYLILLSIVIILMLLLKEFLFYIIIDSLNSLIILLWFRDQELRNILSFLGIGGQYNPLSPDSPIQIIAFTRNIMLFILLISLFTRYMSLKKNGENYFFLNI